MHLKPKVLQPISIYLQHHLVVPCKCIIIIVVQSVSLKYWRLVNETFFYINREWHSRKQQRIRIISWRSYLTCLPFFFFSVFLHILVQSIFAGPKTKVNQALFGLLFAIFTHMYRWHEKLHYIRTVGLLCLIIELYLP